MMKGRFLFASILVCIYLSMTACNKTNTPSKTEATTLFFPATEETSSEHVEDSLSVTASENAETLTTSEISTVPFSGDVIPHLVWTVARMPYISNEARMEINRFLHEKGIECEIEFVDVEGGADYRKWYEQQKQNNTFPDILAVSPWEHGIYDAVDFISSELLPLDDYLDTDEGKRLLDSYCDIEWKQLTIDGHIYTTPKRMRLRPYDIYIYINDRYKDAFEASFDGSYESLRKIREESDEHPIIASYSFGASVLCPFLGYSLKNQLSYDTDLGMFVDYSQDNRLKGLLQEVYNDMQTGLFVSWVSSDILSEDVMAYITVDQPDASYSGYTQYVLSPYRFMIDPGAFGVCAYSSKQELAVQVLSACFSDPEIASLIGYGEVSVEAWDKETEIINAHRPDKLTGFMPQLTKKEIEQLDQMGDEISGFISSMITSRNPTSGIGIVNSDFPRLMEDYFASPKDYSPIYDKINQQFDEWSDKQKVSVTISQLSLY